MAPKVIVRDSKFRHVFAEAGKDKFEDLRPSAKATESVGLKCNGKFFSIGWESGGGGTLAVIPLTRTGRQKSDTPLITGHKGPILDFDWNPFNDNMLASCSEDLTVKVWNIPDEGLKEHLKEPLVNLEGHGKKVSFITWNRCAENIMASSAFDQTVKIWNLEDQGQSYSIDMPDQAWSLKWNYTGSLLATTAKDKKLHVIDPRQQKFAAQVKVHDGSKASKVEWMGSPSDTDQNNRIITTGFSSQAERQIGIWDLRKLESGEPLNLLVLDQGTGALYPFYDPGTGMAYFVAKGDSTVRYFEMVNEEPHIHFISNYTDKQPLKAFDFLPKRGADVSTHSVMKGLKLEANCVLPINFKVPRKSEAFQEDLFPNCPSQEAPLTADKWLEGAECNGPKLQSMEPGKASAVKKSAGPAILSVKELKEQLKEAHEKIKALETENASLKEKLGLEPTTLGDRSVTAP